MKACFLWLLNNSISTGWLILAILLLRFVLSRTSRKLSCILWALVAVRLLCPLSIESTFSVLPASEPVTQEVFYQATEQSTPPLPATTTHGITTLNDLHFDLEPDSLPERQFDFLQALAFLWAVGFLGMVTYAILGSIAMQQRLSASLPIHGNIYSCDYIEEPFIFGILSPRIYLPSCLKAEELPYVLAHEEAHLKRKDHLWKPLGFLLLSVYWFHPIVWVAYQVFCRDVEVACDEAVIENLDITSKAAYSRTLLHYSGPDALLISPLAFGEKDVKHRIQSILRYKKPTVWFTGLGVLAIAIVAVCFLTNPASAETGNSVAGNVTNLLIVGQKERTPEDAKIADSILVATLDEVNQKLKLIGIPGNTYLRFGAFQSHQVGSHLIKYAYALGYSWDGDDGAMAFLEQCITRNFALTIDGNMAIDDQVLIGIIDAFGGIDLNLETDEVRYLVEETYLPEETGSGSHHLDGHAALAYQYMESSAKSTDHALMVAQAVLKQCQRLSKDQLTQLLDTVLPLVYTNMAESQLDTLKQQLVSLLPSLTIELRKCPDETACVEETMDIFGVSTPALIPDLEKCRELLGTNLSE